MDQQHAQRVGALVYRLARAAGLPNAESHRMAKASQYHDLGKIFVPPRILQAAQPLGEDDLKQMQRHVEYGLLLLKGRTGPDMELARTIIETHHERWDGGGYPAGLAGTDIPLAGRITAICDVYDALTSARPYKRPWSPAQALRYLHDQRGKQFDPDLTDLFVAMEGGLP